MRKLHEKSILLGIGIGMIITSIAGMIYSGGTQKELSKEEIISLAKGYGLVEPVKFLNDNKASDNTKAAPDKTQSNSTKTANNSASNNTTGAGKSEAAKTTNKQLEAESTAAPRNISIVVESGFGSKQVTNALLKKGVITSAEEFNSVLASYKAINKIRVGTYWFKKNDDLHYIVKTICKFK